MADSPADLPAYQHQPSRPWLQGGGYDDDAFDMVVLNELDRFHLVMDVAKRVPKLHAQSAHIKQAMRDKLNQHAQYILEYGEDMPEILNWQWPGAKS